MDFEAEAAQVGLRRNTAPEACLQRPAASEQLVQSDDGRLDPIAATRNFEKQREGRRREGGRKRLQRAARLDLHEEFHLEAGSPIAQQAPRR